MTATPASYNAPGSDFNNRRGLVSANPLSTIRTPKQEKRLPKCLDLEQVQKLLEAPGDDDLLAARDKAMLEVLYSSGIRVSELVELELVVSGGPEEGGVGVVEADGLAVGSERVHA